MINWIEVQHVENILLWSIPLLPLGHLNFTQIMRRIYISRFEPSRNLPRQCSVICKASKLCRSSSLGCLCPRSNSPLIHLHRALKTNVRIRWLDLNWVCEVYLRLRSSKWGGGLDAIANIEEVVGS